jgi:hypothetical protein
MIKPQFRVPTPEKLEKESKKEFLKKIIEEAKISI